MSYDLMVFDTAAAPRDRAHFMKWFAQQTQWADSHDFNNPDVAPVPLRSWFQEMIETFPPMNGPLASEDVDDPKITDYAIGKSVIYAAFAWSEAELAHSRVMETAAKHGVGFFDASSDDGDIWFPTSSGVLDRLST